MFPLLLIYHNPPRQTHVLLQVEGTEQQPYRAVGVALEVIPRTLAQNCGANVIRTLTKLRAKHADSKDCTFGIDGNSGKIVDMKELGVWEPYAVKVFNCMPHYSTLHSCRVLAKAYIDMFEAASQSQKCRQDFMGESVRY